MLTHATPIELQSVYKLFTLRRDVFPHVRLDALLRRIDAHQCIFQHGVALTYQVYKKRTRVGSVDIPAKSVMLHQIVNGEQFNGCGGKVFERFWKEIVLPSTGDLYLSVRKENKLARDFYERHGMRTVGSVAWSGGTLPGLVYSRASNNRSAELLRRLRRQL